MPARVHHIGIAVPDLEAAAKFFHDVFGVGSGEVEAEGVKNLYLNFDDFQVQITEYPGRLRGQKFGRLDHISIMVDDLDETSARLKEHGVGLVWDLPVATSKNRTNFTTEDGGVGVVFQLADERTDRPSQPFRSEMMDDL